MGRALAAAIGVLLCAPAARADTRWFRERIAFEWLVGTGGWRTSLGTDSRQPGFDVLAGGGEVLLGIEVGAGVGIVATGRVLAGTRADVVYYEGLAGLGLQLRVSEIVRLRAGAAAGQARLLPESAVMVGGFLNVSVDLFALGQGRLAVAFAARLDVDAMLGTPQTLPDATLALAAGLGLRY